MTRLNHFSGRMVLCGLPQLQDVPAVLSCTDRKQNVNIPPLPPRSHGASGGSPSRGQEGSDALCVVCCLSVFDLDRKVVCQRPANGRAGKSTCPKNRQRMGRFKRLCSVRVGLFCWFFFGGGSFLGFMTLYFIRYAPFNSPLNLNPNTQDEWAK